MKLRFADEKSLPALAKIGQEFYAESGLPGRLEPAVFCKFWKSTIDAGIGIVLEQTDDAGKPLGALGAIIGPDPNDGETVAHEMFWYITKEGRGGGLKLFTAFESYAKASGAKRIGMIHLSNLAPEVLKKLYLRHGYREIETHYIRNLT